MPITSILGRLSLIPAWDNSTIPAALRGCRRELFPLGKCNVNGLGTFERMVLVLRARQHGSNRGIFRDLGGTDPKTTGRSGSLGGLPNCSQRCSPLPHTYGKSAGMVWGRRDHFCYRRVRSVHTKLAPAANSGARICGEPVGTRVDARRSDLRSSSFRARSRGLQSL